MKLHARTFIVKDQANKLERIILDWAQQSGLTMIEMAGVLHKQAEWPIRYALRIERHGNTEKKADEA